MKIVDVKTHVMGTAWRNLTFVRVLEKGYRALKFDPCGSGFYELDKAEKHRVIELVEAV